MEEWSKKHGLDIAGYTTGPYGTNPFLKCMCGYETSPANNCWSAAGEELDDHLRGEA